MRPRKRIDVFFKYCNSKRKIEKFINWLELQTLTKQDVRNTAEVIFSDRKSLKNFGSLEIIKILD